jgi:predicted AlkP superfamily pyrophosphatase or phosphodiesterase
MKLHIKSYLMACFLFTVILFPVRSFCEEASVQPKLVLVSVDSLDPAVMSLNSHGESGGQTGDWLLPNIREFLENSVWFENARCWLPSATDMNHLNAVAGTTSALTGIIGVSQQFKEWDKNGKAVYQNTSMSYSKDDRGRPVDTIFKAFKRKYPGSKVMFASGKGWVGTMFDEPGSGIDFFVTGLNHPDYVKKPWSWDFNPKDARNEKGFCACKSIYQKRFLGIAFNGHEDRFPPDSWVADASLTVMKKEKPDVSMIILAEMDDLQHALGSIRTPDEFEKNCCVFKDKRNPSVHRAPVVAAMRIVDDDFGKFLKGIREIPGYEDALIILYSDHGHMSYSKTIDSNICSSINTDVTDILYKYRAITKKEKKGKGFTVNSIASVGEIYFQAASLDNRRTKATLAKAALDAYRIKNPITGNYECPFTVATVEEMRIGIPGVFEPGELYHVYFADNNAPDSLFWPDIFIFMKSGWQLPVTTGIANNLGAKLPTWLPPLNYLLGGHGAEDTAPIVMAFQGGEISRAKIIPDPEYKSNYRISDIALTLCAIYGLELNSTTKGMNRSEYLGLIGKNPGDKLEKPVIEGQPAVSNSVLHSR